jgi:hypothetical protein
LFQLEMPSPFIHLPQKFYISMRVNQIVFINHAVLYRTVTHSEICLQQEFLLREKVCNFKDGYDKVKNPPGIKT